MKRKLILTRREALISGLAAVGGLILPGCTNKKALPPTYGNILRMGDNLTYAAHKALLPKFAPVKEYRVSEISSFPATGTTNPGNSALPTYSEVYEKLHKGNFADWRLSVEGRVKNPGLYSLDDLMRFPSQTQITRHTCEEGWTAIGQWHGVQLSRVLQAAGVLPTARFVSFMSYDGWNDSIDMIDALHPQTILAYGMNGKALPLQHGAPLRLRVEKQIGYKSMKYLQRIVVTDEYDDLGDTGWAWYTGI